MRRLATLAGVLALGLAAIAYAEEIEGGNDSEKLTGTAQSDQIDGGRGDDTIEGLGGDDTLDGGGDDDRIDGGEGADNVFGAGCDVGELGRLCDNVGHDTLYGGPGDDEVRANKCMTNPNCQTATNISTGTWMHGGAGADVVLGAEARDVAWGDADDDKVRTFVGRDSLIGGEGNDRLDGGEGNDRIWGQPGNDVLTGGRGGDRLSGQQGNDRINARDGARDRVLCGAGKDRAIVDKKDLVRRGCERVSRR
jgi:Ca2+-binding RTX toxin-like protein